MTSDEQAIKDLIESWLVATSAGDIEHIRESMADDATFLRCGHPPIRGRDAYMAEHAKLNRFEIASQSEVREIRVVGDWAYAWNKLVINLTPASGGESIKRTGHILSILRKQPDGKWVIHRDANMLTTGKQ